MNRIILEMTPQETRVRNKGKILLVLSEKVKQVGKNFNDFAQQAIRNLQGTYFFVSIPEIIQAKL